MGFGRRPTGSEIAAARQAAQDNPSEINSPVRNVLRLRRDMNQMIRRAARELSRMRRVHDSVGAVALQAELGTDEYNDFVADYNTIRAALLQASPDLSSEVPDAL